MQVTCEFYKVLSIGVFPTLKSAAGVDHKPRVLIRLEDWSCSAFWHQELE